MAETISQLRITAPYEDYDKITGLLTLEVNFGWEEQSLPNGDCVWQIHCENGDFLQSLANRVNAISPQADCASKEIKKQDWTSAWREFFTPVQAGPFVVLPPWLANNEKGTIIIEPKSAFGTGHHDTTVLCLEALGDLLAKGRTKAGQSFLDLGCGTGVLGMACAKSGLEGLGLDIDPLAVENAEENILLNKVSGFGVEAGSMDKVAGQKFDLILANILAAPLREMAPLVAASLKDGGNLVLSGILDIQADGVEDAYMQNGLPKARRLASGEWRALVFEKQACGGRGHTA